MIHCVGINWVSRFRSYCRFLQIIVFRQHLSVHQRGCVIKSNQVHNRRPHCYIVTSAFSNFLRFKWIEMRYCHITNSHFRTFRITLGWKCSIFYSEIHNTVAHYVSLTIGPAKWVISNFQHKLWCSFTKKLNHFETMHWNNGKGLGYWIQSQ